MVGEEYALVARLILPDELTPAPAWLTTKRMRRFTTRTRARYAETDATGIVYYNSYFVYFELGRVEMFRELGLPYDGRLPIVETSCRYRASAQFDDVLEIQTVVEELRTRSFRTSCQVFRVGDDDEAGARVNLALLKQGVIVRPVGSYGLPQWLRVTIGLPDENAAFIAALERALQ